MKPTIDPLTGGLAWVDQRQIAKDKKTANQSKQDVVPVDINKNYHPRPSK